jgi:hypothetical protein
VGYQSKNAKQIYDIKQKKIHRKKSKNSNINIKSPYNWLLTGGYQPII